MNRRPEPARTSLLFALAAVLWLTVLHRLGPGQSGHVHSRLPLALSWLRDAAFALPLVTVATLAGLRAGTTLVRVTGLDATGAGRASRAGRFTRAGRAAHGAGAGRFARAGRAAPGVRTARSDLAATLARALVLALAVAGALGVLNPLHGLLFGSAHAGTAAGDLLIAFPVLLPLALAVVGDFRFALPRLSRRQARAAVALVTIMATAAGSGGVAYAAKGSGSGGDGGIDAGTGGGGSGGGGNDANPVVVPSATDPGNPCPADAARKSFDVQALDVKVPINRYGDNDPQGRMYALTSAVPAIRAEEASQQVSVGLRDDAIQPLVVRANLGDCVTFTYANNATGGSYGMHIDGLSFTTGSSGDAVGKNLASGPTTGGRASYAFYVPNDPTLEGAHYIHPGPGNRFAVAHGLFGALSIEPAGSVYRNPTTGREQVSGWEADILPAQGKSFREGVKMLHEIGDDNEHINDRNGREIPLQDDLTGGYRTVSFTLNYRSEPFANRLVGNPTEKSHSYSSYTFGDPTTPMPRGYLADPTKFRIVHSGGEKFHVYHLHGGGDRWRMNPHADTSYDYGDTGLLKDPPTTMSPSNRLDSQSMGPGESYDLEIEGGAGGVQQSAGDFLFHCHIAKHYTAGMWSFWRVYNTRQPDLLPLPDRLPLPQGVDSAALIGRTMPDSSVLSKQNLASWVAPQLPPRGVTQNKQDATVWNYTVDGDTYLGEPEDLTPAPDSTARYTDPAHPNRQPGDVMVGNQPKILFDPVTGRPAYPLLRTHVGVRPPFTPNGHSGAPYLGENATVKAPANTVSPWAGRADGLCPSGRTTRTFNITAIEVPVRENSDQV